MSQLAPALDLARINTEQGRDAQALVRWAVGLNQPTIVTTNFRPFEAVILHLVAQAQPRTDFTNQGIQHVALL